MSARQFRKVKFIPIRMHRMTHLLDFLFDKNSIFHRPPPTLRRKAQPGHGPRKGITMQSVRKLIGTMNYAHRAPVVFVVLATAALQPAADQSGADQDGSGLGAPDRSFVINPLGTLPGGKMSGAMTINERGEVAGYSAPSNSAWHAVLWTRER
jgi:hypothetical protein